MKLTKNDMDRRLKWQNNKCYYCGCTLIDGGRDFGNIEIDHIKPHSKHKDGTKENLCLSCRRCNRLKSDYEVNDFRKLIIDRKLDILTDGLFYFEINNIWKGI